MGWKTKKKYRRGGGRGRGNRILSKDNGGTPNLSTLLCDNDIRSNDKNKCVLFFMNIRGLGSKQRSLNKIINDVQNDFQIVILNETALQYEQKPKLNNYISFSRNRKNQAMGVKKSIKIVLLKFSKVKKTMSFLSLGIQTLLLPWQ